MHVLATVPWSPSKDDAGEGNDVNDFIIRNKGKLNTAGDLDNFRNTISKMSA